MAENSKNQTWLDILDPVKMVDDEKVKKQFIDTYSKIHKASPEDAEVIYNKEAIYYKQALNSSDKLKACTRLSLYSAFLELAIQGISIQPGQKSQAYLEARGVRAGKDDKGKDVYAQICSLKITAYGELDLRIMSGQILRMLNPIVVYENDTFLPRTNQQGEIYVDYAASIPRKSKKIIGSWVRIILPGNISDFKWLLEDDIERLKKYSIPKYGNDAKANALYTSENGGIDPGFLEAKTIKHAMRAYTKLRVGDNVAFEGEDDEEATEQASKSPAQSFAAPEAPKPTVSIVTDPNEAF